MVPRKFWKEIHNNLFIGNIKSNVANIQVQSRTGELVEGLCAACEINSYYATVGEKLAAPFDRPWTPNSGLPDFYIPTMQFRFVGEKEIVALTKSLPTNKSSQVEHISMKFLKDALLITNFEICHLINVCMTRSIMPDSWKIGSISPIPKKGLSKKVTDYRPVSVLPAPSKIIERAVYNQIVYHLESHGLLDRRQHGFRKDHSTGTAIFELIQFIYNSLDKREIVGCIYVDYSKAFDTLDHSILCKKLALYGLSAGVVDWCRNYLNNRKQRVKVNDNMSECEGVTYGVPQGSILGPLFFILYVNDVISIFKENDPRIMLYADDTVIYFSHSSVQELQCQLERGMNKLFAWCNINKLTINLSKTKYEIFKPRALWNSPVTNGFTIKLGNTVLEEVEVYNYLGVLIDNRLNFGKFLKENCNKINLRLRQLGKMRKYITCSIANTIYKQTIIPLFDYADFLIGSGQNMYINRLDTLHSKGLLIIDCKKHSNMTDSQLESHYGLITPLTRRMEHHGAIMYRQSKVHNTLDTYRPPIILRSHKKIKFRHEKRNLKGIERSPMYRGIKLWNTIPQALQRATTKVKFKSGLRQHLTMPTR